MSHLIACKYVRWEGFSSVYVSLVDLESKIPQCPSLVISSYILSFRNVQMSVSFVCILALLCPSIGVRANGPQFSEKQGGIIKTS